MYWAFIIRLLLYVHARNEKNKRLFSIMKKIMSVFILNEKKYNFCGFHNGLYVIDAEVLIIITTTIKTIKITIVHTTHTI